MVTCSRLLPLPRAAGVEAQIIPIHVDFVLEAQIIPLHVDFVLDFLDGLYLVLLCDFQQFGM
jgi:hypothetical protein